MLLWVFSVSGLITVGLTLVVLTSLGGSCLLDAYLVMGLSSLGRGLIFGPTAVSNR